MMADKATFRVRKANPQVSVIEVEGQITAFVEDLLMKAYAEATGLTCTSYVCRPGDGAGLVQNSGL